MTSSNLSEKIYQKAIKDAKKDDIIIIGGSLYTISEVLAKL